MNSISKKLLIIVNSVYQLITAINLKCKILADEEVDLIITDISPNLKECISRIKNAEMFERVIFAEILNIK